MGTHGRKHLAHFALGSVALEMLRTVEIPVFALGPHAQRKARREAPRKILHPVSLTGQCTEGVALAAHIARMYRAELQLLHVLPSSLETGGDPASALDWAESAMDDLTRGQPDGEIRTRAVFGNIVQEILLAADVGDADWIVVGTCAGRSRNLNNSTAYHVLAEANCPVLALPHLICNGLAS